MTETLNQNMPEPRTPRRMTGVIDEVLKETAPKARLYHYTTLDGLRGILKSRTMWASDLGFLNDPEEIRYGLNLIRDHVTRRLIERSSDPIEKEVCEGFREAAAVEKTSSSAPYSRFFAFSLSEAGDLLSQWRGYAPNGDGVSLCFQRDALLKRAEEQFFKFIKCRYEMGEQETGIDTLIDKVVDEARPRPVADGFLTDKGSEDAAWLKWIIPGVMVLAAMFKRSSFAAEKEWRLVKGPEALAGPCVEFRIRERDLIPYLEFWLGGDCDPFPVEHVRIGPGPNQELRELAVRGLVDQANNRHRGSHKLVKVERSSITLR